MLGRILEDREKGGVVRMQGGFEVMGGESEDRSSRGRSRHSEICLSLVLACFGGSIRGRKILTEY